MADEQSQGGGATPPTTPTADAGGDAGQQLRGEVARLTAEVNRWMAEAKVAFTKRDALKSELDTTRSEHTAVLARLGEIEPRVRGLTTELDAAKAAAAKAQESALVDVAAAREALAARESELARVRAHAELRVAFLAEGGDKADLDVFGDIAERLLRDGRVAVKDGQVTGVAEAVTALRQAKPKLFVAALRGAPHTGVPSSAGGNATGVAGPIGRQIIVSPTFGAR